MVKRLCPRCWGQSWQQSPGALVMGGGVVKSRDGVCRRQLDAKLCSLGYVILGKRFISWPHCSHL